MYWDDIVIYSKSVEERLSHIQTVISLLLRVNVSPKWRTCTSEDHIDYLGNVSQPGRIGISTIAIDTIPRLKHPTKGTELKSFVSHCNIFGRFVQRFSRISALQNWKLKTDKPFRFARSDKTEIEALEMLQQRLLSPSPMLAFLGPNERYKHDTEVCDKQSRCVDGVSYYRRRKDRESLQGTGRDRWTRLMTYKTNHTGVSRCRVRALIIKAVFQGVAIFVSDRSGTISLDTGNDSIVKNKHSGALVSLSSTLRLSIELVSNIRQQSWNPDSPGPQRVNFHSNMMYLYWQYLNRNVKDKFWKGCKNLV